MSHELAVMAEYQTGAGVDGGGPLVADTWQTYPLNTLVVNDQNIAQFSGVNVNDIILPPGVYEIRGGGTKIMHWWRRLCRIIRVDTGATLVQSISTYDGTE